MGRHNLLTAFIQKVTIATNFSFLLQLGKKCVSFQNVNLHTFYTLSFPERRWSIWLLDYLHPVCSANSMEFSVFNWSWESYTYNFPYIYSRCMPEEAISAIAYNHPHSHSNGGSNGFRINNLHLRGLAPQSSVQQTSQAQSQPLQTPTSMYCDQQQQQLQQQQQQRQNGNMPYLDNHMLHT